MIIEVILNLLQRVMVAMLEDGMVGADCQFSSGGLGRRWGALLTIRYILNVYRDFWIIEYFWGIF